MSPWAKVEREHTQAPAPSFAGELLCKTTVCKFGHAERRSQIRETSTSMTAFRQYRNPRPYKKDSASIRCTIRRDCLPALWFPPSSELAGLRRRVLLQTHSLD